jgi:hypothetical protein
VRLLTPHRRKYTLRQNEELRKLYASPSQDEMDMACSANGEERNAYITLVGKPEGKRPLKRPRRRRVFNIRWILERKDWVVWTGFVWLRTGTSRWLL